jgi:hypothetical protein
MARWTRRALLPACVPEAKLISTGWRRNSFEIHVADDAPLSLFYRSANPIIRGTGSQSFEVR